MLKSLFFTISWRCWCISQFCAKSVFGASSVQCSSRRGRLGSAGWSPSGFPPSNLSPTTYKHLQLEATYSFMIAPVILPLCQEFYCQFQPLSRGGPLVLFGSAPTFLFEKNIKGLNFQLSKECKSCALDLDFWDVTKVIFHKWWMLSTSVEILATNLKVNFRVSSFSLVRVSQIIRSCEVITGVIGIQKNQIVQVSEDRCALAGLEPDGPSSSRSLTNGYIGLFQKFSSRSSSATKHDPTKIFRPALASYSCGVSSDLNW